MWQSAIGARLEVWYRKGYCGTKSSSFPSMLKFRSKNTNIYMILSNKKLKLVKINENWSDTNL